MKLKAVFYAILAAVLYAINMPLSKLLLYNIPSTMLAGFLYLGAGIGIGTMFLLRRKSFCRDEMLIKQDLPCTISMIVLDILAPILLMYGLMHTTSANASLLKVRRAEPNLHLKVNLRLFSACRHCSICILLLPPHQKFLAI